MPGQGVGVEGAKEANKPPSHLKYTKRNQKQVVSYTKPRYTLYLQDVL
jgi:hypothetical protein